MSAFSIEEESPLTGFLDQNTGMKKFLKENKRIRVGTLGPLGTTSSGAAESYIPNPYEDVAKIYWDSDLELIFSFILDSPYYGLAAKDRSFADKNHILIATGPGVHSLIKRLGNELLKTHTFELYN